MSRITQKGFGLKIEKRDCKKLTNYIFYIVFQLSDVAIGCDSSFLFKLLLQAVFSVECTTPAAQNKVT